MRVLTYLRDELKEDIAPVLEGIHPTVPLIREQLVYRMTKANLESLIKAFSNTRSAMSLTMAESFLGEDATHEQILNNSCGIMHMLAELKYNQHFDDELKVNKFLTQHKDLTQLKLVPELD